MDHLHGYWHIGGWQWLFVIEAGPAVVIGILVLRALDNNIAEAKWLSPEQKELLVRNLNQEEVSNESHSIRGVLTNFVSGSYVL